MDKTSLIGLRQVISLATVVLNDEKIDSHSSEVKSINNSIAKTGIFLREMSSVNSVRLAPRSVPFAFRLKYALAIDSPMCGGLSVGFQIHK